MFATIFLMLAVANRESGPVTAPLADSILRVRDVAATQSGGDLPLLVVPASGAILTPQEMRQLVMNRFPGIRPALRYAGSVHFVAKLKMGSGWAGHCWRTRAGIAALRQISSELVEGSTCTQASPQELVGYNRDTRSAFALADIAAGTELGVLRVSDRTIIAKGQKMLLRTVVGPVAVERQVTALQASTTGTHIFVRTDDGVAISSRVRPTRESDQ